MEQTRLKHFRIQAGLSIAALAKKAGVAPSNIYRIEAGEAKRIRLPTIAKLAKALEISEEDLYPLPGVRMPRKEWMPASTTWSVVLICPKCQGRFRITVSNGAPDPGDMGIGCPICGFTQIISLRRGA